MAKKSELGDSQMPDVSGADLQRLQSKLNATEVERDMWKDKYHKERQAHVTAETSLRELQHLTGAKEKKVYEYKDDECRPLSLGQVCEKCGYDYRSDSLRFMMRPTDKAREPHPTSHV